MNAQWDGKMVVSTPGGQLIEMSLGEYVARKNAEIERLRADRRERIATACLAGLLSYNRKGSFEDFAADAVDYADALIARLDKEAAP